MKFFLVDYKSRKTFNGGCNTTYMQKTFVKGWKSYISLHNSDISDVVESSMDDYNFTVILNGKPFMSIVRLSKTFIFNSARIKTKNNNFIIFYKLCFQNTY